MHAVFIVSCLVACSFALQNNPLEADADCSSLGEWSTTPFSSDVHGWSRMGYAFHQGAGQPCSSETFWGDGKGRCYYAACPAGSVTNLDERTAPGYDRADQWPSLCPCKRGEGDASHLFDAQELRADAQRIPADAQQSTPDTPHYQVNVDGPIAGSSRCSSGQYKRCSINGDARFSRTFWNASFNSSGTGVYKLASTTSGCFDIQGFQCPLASVKAGISIFVGFSIKVGTTHVTIIGKEVSINGTVVSDAYQTDGTFNLTGLTDEVLRMHGCSWCARLDETTKPFGGPFGSLQPGYFQTVNIDIGVEDLEWDGVCGSTQSDPVARGDVSFSDVDMERLCSICGAECIGSATLAESQNGEKGGTWEEGASPEENASATGVMTGVSDSDFPEGASQTDAAAEASTETSNSTVAEAYVGAVDSDPSFGEDDGPSNTSDNVCGGCPNVTYFDAEVTCSAIEQLSQYSSCVSDFCARCGSDSILTSSDSTLTDWEDWTNPTKECAMQGDPRISNFDGVNVPLEATTTTAELSHGGDVVKWIVKSSSVHIQALYRSENGHVRLSYVRAVAVSGSFLNGSVLIVGRALDPVTWNKRSILKDMPSQYVIPGLIQARRASLATVRDRLKNDRGMEFVFPSSVRLLVNRQPSHVNFAIRMTAEAVQDGLCGNFNGDGHDDDLNTLGKRGALSVKPQESLFSDWLHTAAERENERQRRVAP